MAEASDEQLTFTIPVRFAPEDPADCRPMAVEGPIHYTHTPTGASIWRGGMCLVTGQGLWYLAGVGWERWATIRPDNGFAIEEAYEGDVPPAMYAEVDKMWQIIIEGMRAANVRARAEGQGDG